MIIGRFTKKNKNGIWRGKFPCILHFKRYDARQYLLLNHKNSEYAEIWTFQSQSMDSFMDEIDNECVDKCVYDHLYQILHLLGSNLCNIIWSYDPRVSDLHLRLTKFYTSFQYSNFKRKFIWKSSRYTISQIALKFTKAEDT